MCWPYILWPFHIFSLFNSYRSLTHHIAHWINVTWIWLYTLWYLTTKCYELSHNCITFFSWTCALKVFRRHWQQVPLPGSLLIAALADEAATRWTGNFRRLLHPFTTVHVIRCINMGSLPLWITHLPNRAAQHSDGSFEFSDPHWVCGTVQ